MGTYLHLRGLTELEKISSPDTSRGILQHLSEPGYAGAREVISMGTPGTFSFVGCANEGYIDTTNEMDDCSNLWAGRLDDIFEELQVKTRPGEAHIVWMGLNGYTGQEIDSKVRGEQGLDGREKEDYCFGKSGIIRNICIENRTTYDVHLLETGGPSAGLHKSATFISSRGASPGESLDDEDKVNSFANGCMLGAFEKSGSIQRGRCSDEDFEDQSERLPNHLLIELLVRIPTRDWPAVACVKKRWAQLFKGDEVWHSALMKKWPAATSTKRWPGPIARGSSRRRPCIPIV